MAERTITTRFVVDGEQEYRASLKNINSELKVLDSELKKTNASMKMNGESLDSLKAKQQTLQGVIDKLGEKVNKARAQTEKAREAQQKWADESEKARQRMRELEDSTDDAGKETEDYKNKVAKLQAEINKYTNYEKQAEEAVRRHTVEANKAETQQNKYQNELDETAKKLKNLNETQQQNTDKSKSMFATMAKGAVTVSSVIAAFKFLASQIKECARASIDFEDAFAGVEKTVDASEEQLREMSDEIRKLSTEIPVTAEEIAKVAEAAGQLGIATDDIMDFTEVMLALGVATNLSSEEAATSLARFANITGMAASEYEKLGSSIVSLGNTTATTEREIVEMSMNLAAAGKQAGLSEAEIMGIAAALSSVGLEAASGGTAFSRWMRDIQVAVETGSKDIETFASVAGMKATEFAQAWRSSPIEALDAFFRGLGSGSKSAIAMLEEMGVNNVRTSDTAMRLASAGDLLARSVETSTVAFMENTALVAEAEKRYDTTGSQIEILKNKWQDLRVEIGDRFAPALIVIVDLLGNLVDALKKNEEYGSRAQEVMEKSRLSLGDLTVSARNLETAMLDLNAANRESSGSIGAVSEQAGAYIAQLEVLESQTALTKQQEIERKAIMQDLVTLVPELSNVIDTETYSIDGGTKALKLNTQAWETNARTQATQGDLETIVMAHSRAVRELTDNEIKLYAAQQKLTEAKENESKAIEKCNSLITASYAEYNAAAAEAVGLSLAVSDAQEEVDVLTEAVAISQETVDKYSAECEKAAETLESLSGSAGQAAEAISQISANDAELYEFLGETTEKVGELIQKYEDMGIAAMQGAEQVAGGLSHVVEVTATSSEDVIKALQSQADFYQTYTENIVKVADMGFSQGLVAALSNGSLESASILMGMVQMTDSEIAAMNAAYENTEAMKNNIPDAVAAANASLDPLLSEMLTMISSAIEQTDKSDEALQAGVSTINGYVNGLNSNLDGVSAAVASINARLDQIKTDIGVTVSVDYSGGGGGYTTKGKSGAGRATGLSYVPYDEYNVNLHKGEMVLTALQAQALRAQERINRFGNSVVNNSSSVSNNVNHGDVHITMQLGGVVVREEADIGRISESIADRTAQIIRRRGGSLMGGRF